MNSKRFILPLAAFIAVCALSLFMLNAASGSGLEAQNAGAVSPAVKDGVLESKEEVVYATLSPEGKLKGIYIVNTLDVSAPGRIVDYGRYASAANLTGLSDIELDSDCAVIEAPAGKLYYQGNMNEGDLPWLISVSYYLNGERISPDALAGGNGALEMNIKIEKNDLADPQYYQNYMLQVSLTLDADKCDGITAKGGSISSAGASRIITFTVMPDNDADFTVKADVSEFSMAGIDFAAVPYDGMGMELPDISALTEPISDLTKAIDLLNDGAQSLRNGISDTADGAKGLEKGSALYQSGLNSLSNSAAGLLSASESIEAALNAISENLNAGDIDLSGLQHLPSALTQFAKGMREISVGLSRLTYTHASILSSLDAAMDGIPAHTITKDEIDALYESVPQSETLNKLVETYRASSAAKSAYESVKEQLAAVNTATGELSTRTALIAESLELTAQELSAGLEQMNPSSLNELFGALTALNDQYALFHSGLSEYTGGVAGLGSAYKEIHSGIGGLTAGAGSLAKGAGELSEGTEELYDNTKDMPGKIEQEIDKLMPDYGGEQFKPVSFASPENGVVNVVQFVIKTEPVQIAVSETGAEEPLEEPRGFWQKLLDLFGL